MEDGKTINIKDIRFTMQDMTKVSFFLCTATYILTRIFVLNEIGEIERKAERELRISEDARIELRMEKKTARNSEEIKKNHNKN